VFPGHRAYVAGTPGFDKVLEAFGRDIVGENGEVNRQALGKIVFGNKVIPTFLLSPHLPKQINLPPQ